MHLPMHLSLQHALDPGESASLISRLLAIAEDAVIVADEALRIVVFNDGAQRAFGYAAEQVLGRPLDLLLPESARAGHAQRVRAFAGQAHAARRMGEKTDILARRADGGLFEADVSIAHLDLNGRTYFAAILRDVSEARRAERALARSEARFRGLASAAPVGIFQADRAGLCVYVNERWCEIAGMAAAEAQGEGWLRAVHPADRAPLCQAWQQAVAAQADFRLRYRFLRPDGGESWVLGNAVPGRDLSGGFDGHIGTVTDVTESHHQSLALERAKSEAEAAARAKSLFLANMSHEIRTPLNAVIGMTTLLLDTPMSEDQRDFARTVRASSETLLEIINDILDYSKADVGKLEIEQRPFDLRRVVEDSLDQVAPRALEKGLNLACLIEEGTPEALVGDATRLRQILANLLSNAVKFTHQGEVFVTADAQLEPDGGCRLRFAVKDTGIGIAAEQLPRLFQSFMQVDASTTRKYGGTGLGLAISKRLAELMGGGVSVQSELGQGSVFGVHVLVQVAAHAQAPEFLRRDVPALRGKRVLIVDDNQTNRRILTKLTMLWGMHPATLPSGIEAIDRLRHGETFDVALFDMSMPELDGIALAAEIRRTHPAERLPIVMLTSLGQRPGLAQEQPVGLAACLSKPIKAGMLYDTLVTVVEGARSGQAAPAPERAAPGPAPQALRLLVAEDNAVNQRVMLRLVQHLGHSAEVAGNGREAVQLAARRRYDVVLMDIQMPELDGVEAARRIVRQRGPRRQPRIIAMTANAMPGDREAYLAAGMDGYLAKPIELQDLADVLMQATALLEPDAAAAGGEGQVLDLARLDHLRRLQDDTQPTLVRDLMDLVALESVGHVERVADACRRVEPAALRDAAHRFLSSAQNIGAVQLSALCVQIEVAARGGTLTDVPALVAALQHERERVQTALAAVRMRY
jgi:PAS domain S-box-containing protein